MLRYLLSITNSKRLNATSAMLYIALGHRGVPSGQYPGNAVMSKILQVKKGAVTSAVESLVEHGLLRMDAMTGNYEIITPATPTAEDESRWADFLKISPVTIPPETPAPVAESKPKTKMNNEQKAWFLQDPQRMNLYLRYGDAAYGKTPEQAACNPSMPSDWLAHRPENPMYPFDWSWKINQFVGYYWDGVCRWRAEHGYDLRFPSYGRACGEFKKLLLMMGARSVWEYAYVVIHHFDLIQFLLGRMGAGLVLEEATLGHSSVRQCVERILRKNDEAWMQRQYDRMRAGQMPEQEWEAA